MTDDIKEYQKTWSGTINYALRLGIREHGFKSQAGRPAILTEAFRCFLWSLQGRYITHK